MEKKHKTMRLDMSLIEEIQKRANKENRSFSNMVEVLLSEAIERNGGDNE